VSEDNSTSPAEQLEDLEATGTIGYNNFAVATETTCYDDSFRHVIDDENDETNEISTGPQPLHSEAEAKAPPLDQLSRQRRQNLIPNNVVTIFQGSPLAFVDEFGDVRRVTKIDMHFERETISKALEDSNVSVDFQIATDDRFGAFLAKGLGRAIHFSCHGHPNYLAFEDGWGQVQFLKASVLKHWIACGGSQLQFVFVSACNSYSIGTEFAEAGIPHVVCCHKETTMLDSGAAVRFTKALYQALAWGKTLRQAFDLACQGLKVYSCYDSQQFCLLPEDGDHDVQIFSRELLDSSFHMTPSSDFPDLPSPTDFFVRDDLEMYRTIQAIKNTRVVRIKGPKGIGKSTLVKECCTYLRDRQAVVNIDDIVWKSVDEQGGKSRPNKYFRLLFHQWRNGLKTTTGVRECIKKLKSYYKERRTLLVLEAKNLSKSGIKKMHSFLKSLIEDTTHLKVVVIYGGHLNTGSIEALPMAFDIIVESLKIESTVKLFAAYCEHVTNRLCPSISNGGDLWRLLVPRGTSHGPLSKRHQAILRMLGGSNPRNVCVAASKISADAFLTLVQMGISEDLDLIQTRSELLLLEFEFKRRIAARRAKEDTDGMLVLERKQKAICCLMSEFEDAKTMRSALELKYMGLLQAERASNSETWFSHRTDLEKLEFVMKKEEDAIISWLKDSRSSLFNKRIKNEEFLIDEKLVFNTGSRRQDTGRHTAAVDLQVDQNVLKSKHGVKACILLLKGERNKLAASCRYEKAAAKAAAIDVHLRQLEELHDLKSATHILDSLSRQLADALTSFSFGHDWERYRITNRLLDKINLRMKRELEAKTQKLSIKIRKGWIQVSHTTETARSPSPPKYISMVNARKERVFGILDQILDNLRNSSTDDEDVDSIMQPPSSFINSSFTSKASTSTTSTYAMSVASYYDRTADAIYERSNA